jgi:hypothetical protein
MKLRRCHVEFLGFGLFGLFSLAGVWLFCRLLDGVERNDGATHGGGGFGPAG